MPTPLRRQKIVISLTLAVCTMAVSVFLPLTASAEGNRYALLVGVDDYFIDDIDKASFADLHTSEDLKRLKDVLIRRFGFAEENIVTLSGKEATTGESIVSAFRTHLINQVGKGDVALFHFSGHGQQVPDDNGDEMDALDEALVPSDYIGTMEPGRHLRDDRIRGLLRELKAKDPANITLFMDSCHSGTATRGAPEAGRLTVRGRAWDGPAPERKSSTRGNAEPQQELDPDAAFATGYVVVSGARSNQTAKEVRVPATKGDPNADEQGRVQMGFFTFNLVKALEAAGPSTTYRELYERLNAEMSSAGISQNPLAEGDLNTLLLDGSAAEPERAYVMVTDVLGSSVELGVGHIHGVTQGSQYAVFKAGTRDFSDKSNRIAELNISKVFAGTSLARSEKRLTPGVLEQLKGARAVETGHSYAAGKLRVATAPGVCDSDESSGRSCAKLFEDHEAVEWVRSGEWDLRLCPVGGDRIILERADGGLLRWQSDEAWQNAVPFADWDGAVQELRHAFTREARWRSIKELRNPDSNGDLKIEMRLVTTNERREALKVYERGQEVRLKDGEYFYLEFRNSGRKAAYFSALNMRSDGEVGALVPHPQGVFIDNVLAPDGKWHGYPQLVFQASAQGSSTELVEYQKVIATTSPSDFSILASAESLEGARGVDATAEQQESLKRALSDPLGRLLEGAALGQKRGESVDPGGWVTDELMLVIEPAEASDE